MANYKKPIQRSLLIGCSLFVLSLCLCLSFQSVFLFSSALYAQYDERLDHILTHIERNADIDDLSECVRTGKPSEKYAELQQLLNKMVDDFGLSYLYSVIPVDDEIGTMLNVVSATSEAERAAGETDLPLLYLSHEYPRKEVERYLSAWEQEGISYFEESSGYGAFYTACKPLRTSDGETVALLCADLSIGDLHRNVNTYVVMNVVLTITIGTLFGIILLIWLRRNVTGPVEALEKSTRSFAEKSHDAKNPEQLSYDAPEIHTLNEVESLADAISRMSQDIKSYIMDILSAEGRIKTAEQKAEGMSRIAYQDALTHVKNKASYNLKTAELAAQIANGEAEFAIVMVDLNHLKLVNDTYGHEKGDKYIVGSCKIISDIYKHSPVYRIGGDEFVIVLQGEDYRNRRTLYDTIERKFREAVENPSAEPWERYSAACGMAEYGGAKETPEQVARRADEIMYHNKQEMKACRLT